MTDLVLKTAQAIVDHAFAYGRSKNLMKLAVAVLDSRGALKCFGAEEGTSVKRAEIAIGKASAAMAMGLGTRTINKMAKDRPYFINSVTAAVGGSFVPVPGGVLIKDAAGVLLGAVGISGDVSDNDEAAAIAGIEAVGLKADPGKD